MSALKHMATLLAEDVAAKVTADTNAFQKLWVETTAENGILILSLGEAAGESRQNVSAALDHYQLIVLQAFKAKITEEVLEQQKAAADALAAALQTRNQS